MPTAPSVSNCSAVFQSLKRVNSDKPNHVPGLKWLVPWSLPRWPPHEPWAVPRARALAAANHAYVFLSIALLACALAGLLSKSSAPAKPSRAPLWFGFACFTAAVAFLGLLSTTYDFHDCFRPSRDFPYFTSGRMMLGTLIPFLLLFTFGLDWILKKWSAPTKFAVLAALLGLMLATEIATDWQIFPNPYNWFHL